MFIKLVAVIVLGITMSLGGPKAQPAMQAEASPEEARVSICIGPMTMGFRRSGGSPVTLSFNADAHSAGFAGLFGLHIHTQTNPLRIHPSTGERAQTLPRRLPSLP